MSTTLMPHYKDVNIWNTIGDDEIDRLQKNLPRHLKEIGITMSKQKRIEFVKQRLKKQKNTCIWGKESNGKYCWNEPKYNWEKDENGEKKECICLILKLQWGHLIPRCRKEEIGLNTLCLQCGRCNNHIQSSRKPEQLIPELLSKISEIIDGNIILPEEVQEESKKILLKINKYFGK